VVRTDAEGRWRLSVCDGGSVFVIKPPHWSSPPGPGGVPRFARLHQPDGSRGETAYGHPGVAAAGTLPTSTDFALRRQQESAAFEALLFADTQPANGAELGYLRDDILAGTLGAGAAFGINHATLTVQSSAVPPSTDIALSGDTDKGAFPGDGYGNQATYVPSPEWLDFGTQSVGIASTPQTLALTNKTLYPFDIDQFALVGGDRDDFAMTANCAVGGKFSPATPCTAIVTFTPKAAGPRSTELSIITYSFNGEWTNRYSINGNGGNAGPAQSVTVVEYYNEPLDHYFITHVAAEQANLDAGNTPTRWTRTGSTFKAYLTEQAGGSPVCRYYIPPGKGDSHFFGRGTVECTATGAANPTFTLEAHEFMFLSLPVSGVCPPATTTIYRVFSNRPDANHRYMTDRAIRDQMVARGWLAEGDGPDLVVMCGAS